MPGFGTPKRTAYDPLQSLGSLRHRVSIQKQVLSKDEEGNDVYDDNGQPVYTWQVLAGNYPCKIETLTGSEGERARQLQADATHRVWARGNPNITEQMKFVFKGRDFFIGYVNDVDQVGRFNWFLCAEKK